VTEKPWNMRYVARAGAIVGTLLEMGHVMTEPYRPASPRSIRSFPCFREAWAAGSLSRSCASSSAGSQIAFPLHQPPGIRRGLREDNEMENGRAVTPGLW
jgi:hypothetical protein